MGRSPCCDKSKVKRGTWSPEEDATLKNYLLKHGTGGNWIALPRKAGLQRCGKSCRLRWLNYLRPDIKHGAFSQEEENIICNLYSKIGSRWSVIASHLPRRTDNDVKNYWNTKLKKKFMAADCNAMKTATATATAASNAAVATAAATTTTTMFDQITTFQGPTNSLSLPTSFPVPFLPGDVSYEPINFNFPRLILEGPSDCSSATNSSHFSSHQGLSPFRPLSGVDENCGGKGIPMDEYYSYEVVSGIWSQEEEALGAGNNADLFSIFHVDSSKVQGVGQSH